MAQAGTVRLSAMDVARFAYEAGFRGDGLINAVAVARAESGYMRDVISASGDYGLWQINKQAHPTYFGDGGARLLADAAYNATAAFNISSKGTNWRPWAVYSPDFSVAKAGTGPYRNYLTEATTAVNNFLGWSGNPSTAPAGPPMPMTLASSSAAPPPPPVWKSADLSFQTQYRQQAFDRRMQVGAGMAKALKKNIFGPTFSGWIEPLKPVGYTRPKGYAGAAVAVPQPRPGTNDVSWAGTNGPVYTGVIQQSGSNGGHIDTSAPIQAVHFLFNPNEISFSYSANPNLLPIAALDETQVRPDLPMSDPANTISFALYFDRTYEVCDGSQLGVYLDIRQLEQLTGITPAQPVMRSYPVKFFFGKPAEMQINALITSINVSYVHFSHEMVPMRATVAISASRLSSVHPYANADTAAFWGAEDYRTKVVSEGVPVSAGGVGSMGPGK